MKPIGADRRPDLAGGGDGKHPTRPGPWGKYPGGPHYPNFGLDAEIV